MLVLNTSKVVFKDKEEKKDISFQTNQDVVNKPGYNELYIKIGDHGALMDCSDIPNLIKYLQNFYNIHT